MNLKRNLGFVFLSIILVIISSCGRVSRPQAPAGATYPHTYIVSE